VYGTGAQVVVVAHPVRTPFAKAKGRFVASWWTKGHSVSMQNHPCLPPTHAYLQVSVQPFLSTDQ
jgi:hypothetical protein